MDWKEFFKPSTGKIILFIILMAGLNYYWISINDVLDARILFGLPLGFYPKGSIYCTPDDCPKGPSFSYRNLIVDIIFWYAVSCLIIFIINKFKKIKK